MVSRTRNGLVLRGPAALLVLAAIAAGVWWSFDVTNDRIERRREATRTFLTIETPGLAEQLAVQQQRVRAQTGRFTSDAGVLVAAWAAQAGDEVESLAARHGLAATAGARGFTVTATVRPDGGGSYRVTVDAGRVTRTCDDRPPECRAGTWRAAIEDRHLLGSR